MKGKHIINKFVKYSHEEVLDIDQSCQRVKYDTIYHVIPSILSLEICLREKNGS